MDRIRLLAVQVVIIDEAHQFYQTHRGYQLILLLERLKHLTKLPLQRILLSATIAQPQKMADWFQGSDSPFEIIQIPGGRAINISLDLITAADSKEFQKGQSVIDAISPILLDHKKVLLFANSRNECDWLFWKLHGRIEDHLSVDTFLHYSTLNKKYREEVERRFQKADRALCIATSTLELGIDIGDIDAVVMYGAPASISSFVQRIGRGNRKKGTCIVYGFCREYHINGIKLGAEHDLIMLCAIVNSMLESELETKPDTELFSVHVQQFFSLTNQYGHVTVDVLKRIINAAKLPSFAEDSDLANILSNLYSKGFYIFDPLHKAYYPTEKWEWLKTSLQLWGNIASKSSDTVIDSEQEIPISQVPSRKVQPGEIFLFAGEPRIVTETTGNVVKTLRLRFDDPKLITYETMGAVTPPEVVQRAQDLLHSPSFPQLPVTMDDNLYESMRSYRRCFRDFNFAYYIPFELIEGRYCYYTFAGTWANQLLVMLLRKEGLKLEADSWRLFTNMPIISFCNLPTSIAALESIVQENLPALISRIQFSYHFHQLPKDLQLHEVCSLLDTHRLNDIFTEIRFKEFKEILLGT